MYAPICIEEYPGHIPSCKSVCERAVSFVFCFVCFLAVFFKVFVSHLNSNSVKDVNQL